MSLSEIAHQYDRFYRRYEKKYEKKISREIRNQILTYWETKYVSAEKMTQIIRELHLDAGMNWAKMNRLNKSRFSDYMFPLLRTYMIMDALNAGEQITQTTIDYVKDILYQATILNWSLDYLRNELLRVEYIRFRGLLIARTELTYSTNLATYILNTNQQENKQKRWVSLLDSKTRRDHRILNNQVRGINEPFEVVNKRGVTVKMDYPGDRSYGAGPEQICNCRCFLIYE